MILRLVIVIYTTLTFIFSILAAIITLNANDFWYETYNLEAFYEQIKACIHEVYNTPCSISSFKRFTVFGKFLFGLLWILFIPGYVINVIWVFIIWSIRWAIIKTCYKYEEDE